jgi:site-specific recombinase XerD
LWTRTTDPSLIRSVETAKKRTNRVNPGDYFNAWCNEQGLKGTTKSTIGAYLGKVKDLLETHPNPTVFDIKEYLSQKQRSRFLSGTIANYIKSFRSFFGYLYNAGLYDLDYRCLRLPKIKYRERRVPIEEQVGKLFRILENNGDKLIFMLLLDCGIRVTELASIKLKNINLTDASIMINGKSGKDRIVYISEATISALGTYISHIKGEYLFPVTRADAQTAHHSRCYFEERLSELCEKAGVEHVTPHQLRHYFATYTLSNGADVKAVRQMLGHADVGITLKIYHHVNARAIREMHSEFSPLLKLEAVSSIA